MLLRVISRQLRPTVLCQRVSYHFAAEKNLLRHCPALVRTQSFRTLKRNVTVKVTADAVDANSPKIISSEKEFLLQENDPDIFGTFSQAKPFVEGQEEDDEDAGDVAEAEYSENRPFRKDRLTIKTYADKIKKNFRLKRVKEAIDVVEVLMIKDHRVKPTNYIYNLLVGECGRLGYTNKAFTLYTRMRQRGLKITGGTYTALFNACANSPYPKSALEKANNLRKIMLQAGYVPNDQTYNAMIKAYGRLNEIDTAFQLVDEMKDHKVILKVDTFNFLLQACISDKEFGFRHALLVWHKIHKKGLKPDLFTFNLMLKCTAECGIGDLDTMRSVIGQILSHNNQKAAENKLKIRARDEKMLEIIPKTMAKQTKSKEDDANNGDDALVTATNTETGEEQIAPVAPATDKSGQGPNLLSKTPHLGSLVALKAVEKPEDRLQLLGGVSSFIEEMKTAEVRPNVKTFTIMLDAIPPTTEAEHELIKFIRKADLWLDVGFFNMLMKKRSMRYDYEGARVCHIFRRFALRSFSLL